MNASRRRAWWLAMRPFSLSASIVPVLAGTAAAADERFRLGLFVLAFAGSVLIHVGTNFATDFFDFVDGVQPQASLGAAIRTGLSPASVHRAAIGCFLAGAACGLAIVAFVGWPILVVGVASVFAGYFYTARPISYGRRGLGEAGVFIFMGLIMVLAAYYVQVEHLSRAAWLTALPVGLLVANILHANNLRDIVNDRARAKVTIATLIDRPAADYGIWSLVIGAFVCVVVAALAGGLPRATLLVLLALPAAWSTLRELRARDAAALNGLVRSSARLHLQFGLLLTLGLLIGALV